VVEKIDPGAVEHREKVGVEGRFGGDGLVVGDAELSKLFAWPLAGIAIAVDVGDAI
jgi:hypothetical protein